jgi:ferredoxin-thioredoxin reductase catalytic chain
MLTLGLAIGLLSSGARAFGRPGAHGRAVGRARASRSQPTLSTEGSKSLKAMTMFANTYAKNTGTFYCSDPNIAAVVIKGLAEHKETLGVPLCPCRHYDDKVAEAKDGFWNCPCTPMRERHECHCMLFLKNDDEFAGTRQELSLDEVAELIRTMD